MLAQKLISPLRICFVCPRSNRRNRQTPKLPGAHSNKRRRGAAWVTFVGFQYCEKDIQSLKLRECLHSNAPCTRDTRVRN